MTINSDSIEPTISYGFCNQHPIMPPSLIDQNLPHNPFNVLATMADVRQDEEYSPQSPEPSNPSPISKPPMTFSTIEGWETPHTTTDDNNFFPRMSLDGSIGIFLLTKHSTPLTPDNYLLLRTRPPHRRLHHNKRES